jgi:hypothetical protein
MREVRMKGWAEPWMEWTKASRSNNAMVKTVNLWGSKSVPDKIYAETVGGQHIKDLVEVNEVFCTGFAENKDVVQVNKK